MHGLVQVPSGTVNEFWSGPWPGGWTAAAAARTA